MMPAATVRDPAAALQALRDNWPALLTSGLVSAFMFGVFVYAAVLYFKRLRHNWKTRWLAGVYLGAALPVGIVSLAVMIAFMTPPGQGPDHASRFSHTLLLPALIVGGILGLAIEIGKGLVYTGPGAVFAVRLREPAFPHLRGWLRERRRRRRGRNLPAARRFPWLIVLLASVAVVGYTAILFLLTKPSASSLLKAVLPRLNATPSPGFNLLAAWLGALIAIKEEVVFRLFIQGAFTWWFRRWRNGGLWAVGLSAAIWTLAHAGMVEPAWVKYAQILPMGILLGLMRRRWGLESTIMVHVLLNLAAVLLLNNLCRP